MEYNLTTKTNDQSTNINMLKHNAEQIWTNMQKDMFHSMKLFFWGGCVCTFNTNIFRISFFNRMTFSSILKL